MLYIQKLCLPFLNETIVVCSLESSYGEAIYNMTLHIFFSLKLLTIIWTTKFVKIYFDC